MSTIRNRVTLIGYLGMVPEFKELENSKISKFSLATSETYHNDKKEKVTKTEWHQIQCWGKLAEICRDYLKKGSQVCIEGSIHYRSYENKEGIKVYVTEIKASEVVLLSSNEKGKE